MMGFKAHSPFCANINSLPKPMVMVFRFFFLVICSRFLFDERGHCAYHLHQVLFSKNQISAKTSPILKEVCNVFLTWFVILKNQGPRLTWFSFSGWTEPMYIKCHAFGDQYRATDTVLPGSRKLKLVFGKIFSQLTAFQ